MQPTLCFTQQVSLLITPIKSHKSGLFVKERDCPTATVQAGCDYLLDKEKHGLHFIPAPFHFHAPLCVIPAKAGIQPFPRSGETLLQSLLFVFTFPWIPAFAGMTHSGCFYSFFIASGMTRASLLIAPVQAPDTTPGIKILN